LKIAKKKFKDQRKIKANKIYKNKVKKVYFVNVNDNFDNIFKKKKINIKSSKNKITYKNKLISILSIYYFVLSDFHENFD
jgi:hypothetical protein